MNFRLSGSAPSASVHSWTEDSFSWGLKSCSQWIGFDKPSLFTHAQFIEKAIKSKRQAKGFYQTTMDTQAKKEETTDRQNFL